MLRLPSALLAGLLSIALIAPASVLATMSLLRPDPLVSGTFYGRAGISTDGIGGGSGNLQAEVPAGSTIEHAWLYTASTPSGGRPSSISFAGETVALSTINNDGGGATTRGDVTSIVAGVIGSSGGVFDFAINPSGVQGAALAVIYSNPSLPLRTIAILDGGSLPTGDSATFSFASPIDPTAEGFEATLALGIVFSYQGAVASHACGSGQVSHVDINGTRLTSCAGNADDSLTTGGLITVGGVGDDTDNPPDPNGAGGSDDELYNLVPLLNAGDTGLTVATVNPSNNDYIFLAAVAITARASVAETGAPTISAVADQEIEADTSTGALAFTVDDAETAPADLVVTAAASNATLVPDGAIVFGGSGANRTVTVTPAAGLTGTSTIALTVTDGDAKQSVTTFELTVVAPAATPVPSAEPSAEPSVEPSAEPSPEPSPTGQITGVPSAPKAGEAAPFVAQLEHCVTECRFDWYVNGVFRTSTTDTFEYVAPAASIMDFTATSEVMLVLGAGTNLVTVEITSGDDSVTTLSTAVTIAAPGVTTPPTSTLASDADGRSQGMLMAAIALVVLAAAAIAWRTAARSPARTR